MKKGDLTWETIGRLIMVLVVLIIIVLVIYLIKGDLSSLVDRLKTIIRFGG